MQINTFKQCLLLLWFRIGSDTAAERNREKNDWDALTVVFAVWLKLLSKVEEKNLHSGDDSGSDGDLFKCSFHNFTVCCSPASLFSFVGRRQSHRMKSGINTLCEYFRSNTLLLLIIYTLFVALQPAAMYCFTYPEEDTGIDEFIVSSATIHFSAIQYKFFQYGNLM